MPTEIRVSIVAAPCRRFVHAARWNGQAPYATTGAASVSESHCQLVNCSAGHHRHRDHRDGQDEGDQQPLPQRAERVGGRVGPAVRTAPAVACPARPVGPVRRAVRGAPRCSRSPRPWRSGRRCRSPLSSATVDLGLFGGVVDGGADALHPVEFLLDPGRARGAGHAADRQLDLEGARSGRVPGRAACGVSDRGLMAAPRWAAGGGAVVPTNRTLYPLGYSVTARTPHPPPELCRSALRPPARSARPAAVRGPPSGQKPGLLHTPRRGSYAILGRCQ